MNTVILYNPKEKVRLRVPYIPFALMTLATALKSGDFDVKIIDARVENNSWKTVKESVQNDCLFFGITMITGSVIHDALETAKYVKQIRPDIKVIVGGVHPSLLPEETALCKLVDYVVIGPGEEAVVNIARCIQEHRSIHDVPGIGYERNGKFVLNHRSKLKNDFYQSGINYDLLDLTNYIKSESSGNRCLDYLSSRGCPHVCTYCAISKVWGQKVFKYPSEKMVDDIERLIEQYNIDSIHFLDDNFFISRTRVEQFCDEILRRNIRIHFWSMCRCNYFSKYESDFLQKLKQAGFYTWNFGAESGSQYILDCIKKDITVEQIIQTAKKCNDYGFRAQFSFMTGFPFESENDREKTMYCIDEIHSINPNFDIQLFPFIPFPKTDLCAECIKHGFKIPEKLEDWAYYEYGNISMPWLSKQQGKYLQILTTVAWFAFTTETIMKLGKGYRILYKIFNKIARFRWKHRFFRFPWEWELINIFVRK